MNDLSIDCLRDILSVGGDFAACRLPGESDINILRAKKTLTYDDIEEVNGRRGFVIYPYDVRLHPGVLLEADEVETMPAPASELPEPHRLAPPPLRPPSDYSKRFNRIIKALRDDSAEKIDKAVLSHGFRYGWDKATAYPAAEAFARACLKYPSAYVFMFRSKASGLWMGCSPEILLVREEGCWKTVALAGTAADRRGLLSDKNMMEHRVVVDYIREVLMMRFGGQCNESGPRILAADSGVIHLCTEMTFAYDRSMVGSILKALHPTPAVSCMYRSGAKEFTDDFEGYDRKYYTGFTGMLDPYGRTAVYVNLRCMNIERNRLTLYAGGGLMSQSTLQEEWGELTSKLKTMLSVV